MTDLEKAARMALEALGYYEVAGLATTRVAKSITALRQALSDSVEQPAQQQEPKLSEIFCVVDFADKLLSVSVLRRRNDDVAELLHFEQIALPAQQEPFKPDWVNYRQGVEDGRAEALEMLAKQEPVAFADGTFNHAPLPFGTPLYAAPQPSKPWVGLAPEEREMHIRYGSTLEDIAISIEAKLKEKNA